MIDPEATFAVPGVRMTISADPVGVVMFAEMQGGFAGLSRRIILDPDRADAMAEQLRKKARLSRQLQAK